MGDREGVAAFGDLLRSYRGAAGRTQEELADQLRLADVLNDLGNVANEVGDVDSSLACHNEALAIRRHLNDQWDMATPLNDLGNLAFDHGDDDLAQTRYEESLQLRRTVGDQRGIAAASLREVIGGPLSGVDRAEQEQSLNELRVAIGTDAFETAWAVGQALLPDQALRHSLGDESALPGLPKTAVGSRQATRGCET
jgi:tetratricopeptide (TPR) repeat protein